MTKIKVRLRPSKIAGKPGTLCYCVSHKSIVRCVKTAMQLMPGDWDEGTQRVLSEDASGKRMQNRIESDLSVLDRIVRGLESRRPDYTADDVVAGFCALARQISVSRFLQEQIGFLTECKRLGTAMNYRRAASTLSAFVGGREVCFSELTESFVEQYKDYLLRRGMVRNSLSFHMRILRAVYNKAVRSGYAEQTFPFRNVYTGIDRTRKRAVSEQVIRQLIRLDLADSFALTFARDLFLFSFYTRGMAFVDMAYLRKSDFQDGVIRYTRHKTGQELSIRIEPCIRAIAERYAGSVYHTPYVFPILTNEDADECFRRYKTALRAYNSRLANLSRRLGLAQNLSSYTSRHSWATMARNQNIPIAVISAGMGHASERTTQIYLTSLENSLIDNANKGILERFDKAFSR